MKHYVLVGAGLITGALVAILMTSCSGNRQQDAKSVKDVIHLADDTCVVIRDFAHDGGPANDVCAKEDEIAPFVHLILGARKVGKAVGDGGSPAIPDASK